jgi:hypothetical protein
VLGERRAATIRQASYGGQRITLRWPSRSARAARRNTIRRLLALRGSVRRRTFVFQKLD